MGDKNSANLLTDWICRISRLSALYVGREMSRLGFGPAQFFILSELYMEDGISQNELSRRVVTDKSNTSRALTKLEQYGLIRRQIDPDHHKVKRVYLEPKAVEIEHVFNDIRQLWNSELLSNFSKKETQALLSGIKKTAANAEAYFFAHQPKNSVAIESDITCENREEI